MLLDRRGIDWLLETIVSELNLNLQRDLVRSRDGNGKRECLWLFVVGFTALIVSAGSPVAES